MSTQDAQPQAPSWATKAAQDGPSPAGAATGREAHATLASEAKPWRPAQAHEAKPYVFSPVSSGAAAAGFGSSPTSTTQARSLRAQAMQATAGAQPQAASSTSGLTPSRLLDVDHDASLAEPSQAEQTSQTSQTSSWAAREEELRAGFERALEQARAQAQAAQQALQAEHDAERQRWAKRWSDWQARTVQWRRHTELLAAEVALDLAEELAASLLEDALEGEDAARRWRAMIQGAILRLAQPSLTLELPVGVAALLEPHLDALRAASPERPAITLREDPSLEPAAFRVLSDGGIMDADPARRIARLKAALRHANPYEVAAEHDPALASLEEVTDPILASLDAQEL